MYEVEVKAVLKDRKAVMKKLQDLGCKFGEELHQIDSIFTPKGEIFPPPKGTPVLRIRKENNLHLLTLKVNQTSRQDCIEHEVEIKGSEEMEKIIGLLGFKDDVTVDKVRIKTKCKDTEVVLDTVKGLGEYIEAEKITTESEPTARVKIQTELLNFLETLGVPKSDQVIDGKYDIMLYERLKGK
jgi:adenylate cyclase class 2